MSKTMNKLRYAALREELGRHWLSVADDLPLAENSLVWVYGPGFEVDSIHFIAPAIYTKDGWLNAETHEPLEIEVTHWMPFPRPPISQEILLKVGQHQYPVDVDPCEPPPEIVIRGREKVHVYNLVLEDK